MDNVFIPKTLVTLCLLTGELRFVPYRGVTGGGCRIPAHSEAFWCGFASLKICSNNIQCDSNYLDSSSSHLLFFPFSPHPYLFSLSPTHPRPQLLRFLLVFVFGIVFHHSNYDVRYQNDIRDYRCCGSGQSIAAYFDSQWPCKLPTENQRIKDSWRHL